MHTVATRTSAGNASDAEGSASGSQHSQAALRQTIERKTITPALFFGSASNTTLPKRPRLAGDATPSPPPLPPQPPLLVPSRSDSKSTDAPEMSRGRIGSTRVADSLRPRDPHGKLRVWPSGLGCTSSDAAKFYSKHFPIAAVHEFHSRAPLPSDAARGTRELAFECLDREVAPIRYKTAASKESLLDHLGQGRYVALHYGARLKHPERADTAIGRELVIDVDLGSGSAPIRSTLCRCGDKEVCNTCIRVARMQIDIVRDILEETFGLKRHMIDFSGRRGFHLTVLDDHVFLYDKDARSAIVDNITIHAPSLADRAFLLRKEQSLLLPGYRYQRAFRRHIAEFADVYMYQGAMFLTKRQFRACLYEAGFDELDTAGDRIPRLSLDAKDDDPSLAAAYTGLDLSLSGRLWNDIYALCFDEFDESIDTRGRSLAHWWEFVRLVTLMSAKNNLELFNNLMRTLVVIVLLRIWPQVDLGVTKEKAHLCRSPFSLHPGTGALCMPIEPSKPFELETHPVLSDFVAPESDEVYAHAQNRMAKAVSSLNSALSGHS